MSTLTLENKRFQTKMKRMNTFIRRIGWIVLLLEVVFHVAAQEYLYEIGGSLGSSFYMGDANMNSIVKGYNPSLGAVFRYNTNFRWSLKANLLWGQLSGSTEGLENVFPGGINTSFDRSFVDLGGQAEFNFWPYGDKFLYRGTKRVAPYLLGGIGLTMATGGTQSFFGPHISLGLGVKYKLKPRLNLGMEFSFRKLFSDGLDVTDDTNAWLDSPYKIAVSVWKNKDWYGLLNFTITWNFGKRKKPCNNIDCM